VCASQQDTGDERQPPDPPQPRVLSPPSSRTPKPSSVLLTLRVSGRPSPDNGPLAGEAQGPANGPVSASEPPTSSEPSAASEPPTSKEPLALGEDPPRVDSPQRLAETKTYETASAGGYAASVLDASLIVIGAAMFLCALATLSLTSVWSWHAGSAGTFNLSHMHGICTSAMGELAQGASTNVASHCLWVDGTWTEAIALTAGGCILAVIGIARIVGARRRDAVTVRTD
jgi:hypothetical protein